MKVNILWVKNDYSFSIYYRLKDYDYYLLYTYFKTFFFSTLKDKYLYYLQNRFRVAFVS